MHYLIITLFVAALMQPSISFAQMAESKPAMQSAAFEARPAHFRGKQGSGFRFKKRGHRFHGKGRHHRRNRLHFYPYYYDRNYGGYRKFFPWQDRSYYPYQGGSDYRQWFDLYPYYRNR